MNAEKEIRIDWVGEPGHAQPQDRPSTPQPIPKPNASGPVYDTRQALNALPDDNDDDDLQQKVEPIDKGTFIEFDEQRILKP